MSSPPPPVESEVLLQPSSWLDAAFFARALGVPRVTACHVCPAVAKGDNYASVVYKCTARTSDNGEEDQGHRLIVKCLPSNALRQAFSNKVEVFRKERDMYTRIFPRYEAMLSGEGPRSFPWPKYYASHVDGRRDYIVLQDLGQQGFLMAQRMKGLDSNHLALVLSALGEFHACSVAFETLGPVEEFEAEVVGPFRDLMYTEENQDMMKWVQRSVETAAASVRAWGPAYGPIARWITDWARTAFGGMMELLRPGPGALLCHGDVWLNNMLFKYQQTEGGEMRPRELKLLDFQMARYASPATDLLYLMVTSTTAATRRQHWSHLLEQEYLRSFWKTLESLGVKNSIRGDVYSMGWLRREMRRAAPWALFNAVIVLRAVLLEAKDAPDLDQLTEEDIKEKTDFFQGSDDMAYQGRLRDLINELSEDGLFDG